MTPVAQASLNLYAPASLYVNNDKVSNLGMAKTSGKVVSPALMAKQKPKALIKLFLLTGNKTLQIMSILLYDNIRDASIVSLFIFDK